jgi:hypothetical protein
MLNYSNVFPFIYVYYNILVIKNEFAFFFSGIHSRLIYYSKFLQEPCIVYLGRCIHTRAIHDFCCALVVYIYL